MQEQFGRKRPPEDPFPRFPEFLFVKKSDAGNSLSYDGSYKNRPGVFLAVYEENRGVFRVGVLFFSLYFRFYRLNFPLNHLSRIAKEKGPPLS